MAAGRLAVDHVHIGANDIEETGAYDLEGLFVRLGHAVDSIGAKRVVIDTIEALFLGLPDVALARAEVRRLFSWLKDRGLTAVITGERGEGELTRYGLEEYISDCVILLDNRIEDQIATRRLRIVKYRGSLHGTNEYPFLIDAQGISVLPTTSSVIVQDVSSEIISTGISGLDAMLRNGGFFRGSSILLSGGPGTGKTVVASHFIDAACEHGERCMFVLFEESAEEVCRNALCVGLDLGKRVAAGLLRFEVARPSMHALEMHLARMYRALDEFNPTVVVIDPISAFRGPDEVVHSTLLRMVDLLKSRGITALFTSLKTGGSVQEDGDEHVSSLMDSWIKLMNAEDNGERNRLLYVIKSRGTSHSNQVREYLITDTGIELVDAYIGAAGVLTGTARVTQQAHERAVVERRRQAFARRRRDAGRRRQAIERQIAELQSTLEGEDEEAEALLLEEERDEAMLRQDRSLIAARRGSGG
jgi:circadian clock protein KaiC